MIFSLSVVGCGVPQNDYDAVKADLAIANEALEEFKVRQSTCATASLWRVAAQELLYTSNDGDRFETLQEYRRYFFAAFIPLANIPIPSVDDDPKSKLLPLMKKWPRQMEEYHSLLDRGTNDEIEALRLDMNNTITNASELLNSECRLAPLILYQPHP